jgi:glycine cleavage system H protein
MDFPEDLKYTKEHEWARVEGTVMAIGITEYAQENLGEIVYVELPEEGAEFSQGEAFGVVESTKAVSDLYCPVSGTIVEINDTLVDNPELINEDPYEDGWIIRIEMNDSSELGKLLNASEYAAFIEEEQEKEG